MPVGRKIQIRTKIGLRFFCQNAKLHFDACASQLRDTGAVVPGVRVNNGDDNVANTLCNNRVGAGGCATVE